MITLQKVGDALKFTFTDNPLYLQNGTIEVPVNSLTLVTDNSGIATFKKSASNDIFVCASYDELGMSKSELESWFKENAVGGGGGGTTPEEVQQMIDESISGKVNTSSVVTAVTSGSTDSEIPTAKAVYDAIPTGSSITIDPTLDSGSTNAVANSAVSAALNYNDKFLYRVDAVKTWDNHPTGEIRLRWRNPYNGNTASTQDAITLVKINNIPLIEDYNSGISNLNLVETSAITSAVTSASTDSEIPTAKAVYDAIPTGSSITIDPTLDTGSTNAVANSAITTSLNNKANKYAAVGGYRFGSTNNADFLQYRNVNNGDIGTEIYYPRINGKGILTNNSIWAQNNLNFSLVETSAITSAVTSASTDSEVPSAKAVYDAVGQGGGTTYSAGRGIDITNDTISFSLPISAGTFSNSIIENESSNVVTGEYGHAEGFLTKAGYFAHSEGRETSATSDASHAEGHYTIASGVCSHAEGYDTIASGVYSHAEGIETISKNYAEHASGSFNVSSSASTTFGDGGNTLFSVGNGTADDARHNAFEIRQNGDIYYFDGTNDVKLQDKFSSLDTTIGNINSVLNNI